jgi:hypothetical protein
MVVHEYVFLVYTEIVEMVVDYALAFVEQGRCFLPCIDRCVLFARIECEYE